VADFSKRIQLVVDVVTGNAKSGLSSLKTEIDGTEGSWNKLRVAGGGAMDFVKDHATAFAATAGTAIAGFAVKAVSDYNNLALSAGDLSNKTGLAVDQASRFQEVMHDLGIPVDAVAASMNKMNREAATTPGAFSAIGAQIVRTKNGAIDVQATFLNVIDALNKMPDASARAAAAQQIFGKGWQSVSLLVGEGADKLREQLAGVEKQKLVNPAQVAQARDFKATMADLHDSAEDLTLTLGKALAPAFAEVASTASDAAGPVAQVIAKLAELNQVSKPPSDKPLGWLDLPEHIIKKPLDFKGNWDLLNQSFRESMGQGAANVQASVAPILEQGAAAAKAADAFKLGADGLQGFAQKSGEFVKSTDQAKAAASLAKDATAEYKQKVDDLVSAQDAAAQSADGFASALDGVFGSATNVQAAADQAQNKFAALSDAVKNNGNDFDGNSQKARDNRDALRGAVESAEGYISTLAKSGATSEQVQGVYQDLRGQLVRQMTQFGLTEDQANNYIDTLGLTPDNVTTAVQLQGKENAKAQVLDYLHNSVDQIPANVRTAIFAALQRGDFDEALRLINNIPRNVTTTVRIQTIGNPVAGTVVRSAEGRFASGGSDVLSTLAEEPGSAGDEVVLPLGNPSRMAALLADPRVGPRVAAVLGSGSAGAAAGGNVSLAGGGDTIVFAPNVNVTVGVGANVREFERAVENALAALVRRNGPGPLQRALKIA
jgi:hypothetical protein